MSEKIVVRKVCKSCKNYSHKICKLGECVYVYLRCYEEDWCDKIEPLPNTEYYYAFKIMDTAQTLENDIFDEGIAQPKVGILVSYRYERIVSRLIRYYKKLEAIYTLKRGHGV